MAFETYKKLCTEFYDLDKPTAPESSLQFYLQKIQASPGPVLEPMCGSGRFLIPLLERKINVEGVDASPHMLAACREHCRKKNLTPVLHEQRLEELSLPRRYGSIFIPAGSFGFILETETVQRCLKLFYEHLLPGGVLILVVQTPVGADPGSAWHGKWVTRPDGAKLLCSSLGTYAEDTRIERTICKYELFKDGRLLETELEEYVLRRYTKSEIEKFTAEAGFSNIRTQPAFVEREVTANDGTIVVTARKA